MGGFQVTAMSDLNPSYIELELMVGLTIFQYLDPPFFYWCDELQHTVYESSYLYNHKVVLVC